MNDTLQFSTGNWVQMARNYIASPCRPKLQVWIVGCGIQSCDLGLRRRVDEAGREQRERREYRPD